MVTDTIRPAATFTGTTANLLAGRALQIWGQAGTLTLYGNGDIAGMSVILTAFKGSQPGAALIPSGASLGIASTPGKVKTNEDFIGMYPIDAGSQLVLIVTNPGAASNVTFQLNAG